MRIDITEIAGINGAYIDVEKDIPSSELVTGINDVKLGKSIHVALKIKYIEGMFIVSGIVSGKYSAVCGRCLIDIKEQFSIDLHENFSHVSNIDEASDDYEYDGRYIDLDAPLIDNILLGLPSSMLCREDCRGLCSLCGKNLNEEECSCDRSNHNINLQMEKLKEFFDK